MRWLDRGAWGLDLCFWGGFKHTHLIDLKKRPPTERVCPLLEWLVLDPRANGVHFSWNLRSRVNSLISKWVLMVVIKNSLDLSDLQNEGFKKGFCMDKWIKILKDNTNLVDRTWKYLRLPWMSMILPLGYNFEQDLTWNKRKTPNEGSVPPLLHLQNQTPTEICSQMKKISYILHL